MKAIPAIMFILWWAVCVSFSLGMFSLSIYGIYLAFCASVILGVVTLFVPPAALSFGVIQFIWHVNLPVMIVQWLSSHHG